MSPMRPTLRARKRPLSKSSEPSPSSCLRRVAEPPLRPVREPWDFARLDVPASVIVWEPSQRGRFCGNLHALENRVRAFRTSSEFRGFPRAVCHPAPDGVVEYRQEPPARVVTCHG